MNVSQQKKQKDGTIFLTGATGYLGSRIAYSLSQQGYRIVALARPSSHIPSILEDSEIDWFRFSNYPELRNAFKSERIFDRVQIVVHCATNYGRGDITFIDQLEANLFLPLHLLDIADRQHIPYFINTDTILDKRVSIYSRSKDQFSDWIKSGVGKTCALNCVLEHFYGPFDDQTKFLSWLLNSLLFDDCDINLTKGMQKRDFIYVSDVVSAFVLLIEKIDLILAGESYRQI